MNGLKLLTQTGGIGRTSVVWKRVTILADQITPDPTEHRRTTVAAFARQLKGPWPESAVEFDGGKAHVVIPTLNYDGSYAITYEAFVTPDVLENVFIADTQRSGAGFGVRKTGYTLHAWNGSAYQSVFADQPATRYLRVHVAATLQDGQLRVFVNGKRQTAATRLTDGKFAASRFPMIVGASPSPFDSGIDNPFTGVIDGVRISKGVRYTDDFTVPIELKADETTIAAYRFDEGQDQTLSDSSGNSHDGQIKGAKWVTGTAIRSRAARGLVDFGRHAVTELVEGLSHENAIVRLEAAIALGRIGRDAKQAVAALERAAADDDQRVRAAAVRAIARIELNGDAQ